MQTFQRTVLVLSAMALVSGCKKGDAGSEAPGGGKAGAAKAAAGKAGPSARSPVDLLAKAAKWLPAATSGVMLVDVRAAVGGLTGGGIPLVPPVADPDAFRADLGRVLTRFIGFDPTRTDYAVVFLDVSKGSKVGGVLLVGDFGKVELKGKKAQVGDHEVTRVDGKLYAVVGDGWLGFGPKGGLKALLAKDARLEGDRLKRLSAALDRTGTGMIAVAGDVQKIADVMLAATPLKGMAVTSVSATLATNDGGLAVSVAADDSGRAKLKGLIEAGLGMARGLLQTLAGQIDTAEDPEKALMGVAAKHLGVAMLDLVKVTDADGALTVRVKLAATDQSMPVVAMVGVLSAVAVPAFIKYQRRAKTTEAIDQLDKIYKGASYYYTAPRVSREGTKLPCQFPASVKATPAGSPCDHPDNKYPGSPSAWTAPTWSALNFQMNDAHYFRYEFTSSGTLGAAQFTAAAYGDLDCDGVWSTFERHGYGDPSASNAECSMKGSSAFYKNNETE